MYYEEKWINGILSCRTSPTGDWAPMSQQMLNIKVKTHEAERARLQEVNNRLYSLLCDIKEKVEFEVGI